MEGNLLNARHQRIALTIGGSDSSAQAGVQADLRTFAAYDVHGLCAFTALTIQDHEQVIHTDPVSPALLTQQIESMLRAFPVRAVKTGMLVSASHVEAVSAAFTSLSKAPLVVDPVLCATSGARLLDEEGETMLVERLLPHAAVFTPNLPEAIQLTSSPPDASPTELATACAKLLNDTGIVVLKGGHNDDPELSTDLVRLPNGVLFKLDAPRIQTSATRGTGCTFAAAIAAGLAHGLTVDAATRKAKRFITDALKHSVALRNGRGPVGQLWSLQMPDNGGCTS